MPLTKSLLSIGADVRYDQCAKEILANAQILGRIVQQCVDEFKDKPLAEVIAAVSKCNVSISSTAVEPGMTNQIQGLQQEDSVRGEGNVYFDLLFNAETTGSKTIIVRINFEARQKYHPGYDTGTRKNALQAAANLIKRFPSLSDQEIADIASGITVNEVAVLRKEAQETIS